MPHFDPTNPLTWIGFGIATSLFILAVHILFSNHVSNNVLPSKPPEGEFTVKVKVEWPD